MEYRITEEKYFQIFNKTDDIEDLNEMSFDLMIDLYTDILTEYNNNLIVKIDDDNKRNIVIYSLYNYLFKIMNTYCMFTSGSHRIGATILSRTIFEIDIKIKYLLSKNDEELYTKYINSSLIAEKFYLNELEGFKSFEKEFVDGTKKSIYKLLENSKIDDVNELSRKNSNFPKIEDMCNYLIDNEIISKASYNIAYRTFSNYTHANWSAVENEMFRNTIERVDMRLIAPMSVMIIISLLFSNEKMNNISPAFIKKLEIYKEAFIILDSCFINRYWVKENE